MSQIQAIGTFALVGFVLLTLLVLRLLAYFKAPSVSWPLAALVFVSWLLGFSGLLLLPADIAVAASESNGVPYSYDVLWGFIYWSTFVLSWIVMPILMQYYLAGDFTWKERLHSAVHANLRFYVASAVLGVILGIYILATSHYTLSALLGFLIAYANTYGMMIIVVLLGNGLVAFPRKLWEMASPVRTVETLELIDPYADHELYDALFELEDCELEVKRLKDMVHDYERNGSSGDVTRLREYLRQLDETCQTFEYGNQMRSQSKLNNQVDKHESGPSEPVISERMCVDLNTRLRRAQELVFRARRRMDGLYGAYAKATEEVEKSLQRPLLTSAGVDTCCAKVSNRLYYCLEWLHWSWRAIFKGMILKGLSIFCASLSVVLLWSEVTMVAPMDLSPLGLTLSAVRTDSAYSSISIQALSFVPLAYMGTCMYWSLFRLKVVRTHSLQGPALSSAPSLLFNAQLLVRLQFSLCYNYIRLLKYTPAEHTAFSRLMKDMTVAPILGTSFNIYSPLVLVLLAGFTLWNGYPRLLKLIGLIHEDAALIGDPDEIKERRTEGSRILQRNLKTRNVETHENLSSSRHMTVRSDSFKTTERSIELSRSPALRTNKPVYTKLANDVV